MATKEELNQMRKEVELQKREIELSNQLLEQKKILNKIRMQKVEHEKKEFETVRRDCAVQTELENIAIKRVQKKKQNIQRMKKALNINTISQVKKLPAPVLAPDAPVPVKEVIVKAVSNSEVVEEPEKSDRVIKINEPYYEDEIVEEVNFNEAMDDSAQEEVTGIIIKKN